MAYYNGFQLIPLSTALICPGSSHKEHIARFRTHPLLHKEQDLLLDARSILQRNVNFNCSQNGDRDKNIHLSIYPGAASLCPLENILANLNELSLHLVGLTLARHGPQC